jgi:hypothetical protein
MKTARKIRATAKPKRPKRPETGRLPGEESGWKPPTKAEIEEQRRWLDEYVPPKLKRYLTGEEIEHAIKTGGM